MKKGKRKWRKDRGEKKRKWMRKRMKGGEEAFEAPPPPPFWRNVPPQKMRIHPRYIKGRREKKEGGEGSKIDPSSVFLLRDRGTPTRDRERERPSLFSLPRSGAHEWMAEELRKEVSEAGRVGSRKVPLEKSGRSIYTGKANISLPCRWKRRMGLCTGSKKYEKTAR